MLQTQLEEVKYIWKEQTQGYGRYLHLSVFS